MSTRREFLVQLGSGVAGLVGLSVLPGCESIDVESKVAGERVDFITSPEDGVWYWQAGSDISKDEAPEISREDWSLTIEGAGLSETVEFADLQAMADDGAETTYLKTMRCVFGQQVGVLTDSLVSTGVFTGVPLAAVLEQYDLPDGAVKVRTFGADGFRGNIAFDRVVRPDDNALPVLLAYRLNDQPLTRLRGGPVRLVVPEAWGYKNMKWLTRLELSKDDSPFGRYEDTLFTGDNQDIIDEPGEIALLSTVTKPTADAQEVTGPDVTISGTSFAGGTAIESAEMALDGGDFEPLELPSREDVREQLSDRERSLFDSTLQAESDEWPFANVWVTWTRTFEDLAPGSHTVTIRAADRRGRRQSESSDERLEVAPRVDITFTVV